MNQKQRDILCKMLHGNSEALKRELKKRFPDDCGRWGFETAPKHDENFLDTMSSKFCLKYNDLVNWAERMEAEKKQLEACWNKLYKEFEIHQGKQQVLKNVAVAKLNDATKSAVIEIQFADDADKARAILNSLPSIDELIS